MKSPAIKDRRDLAKYLQEEMSSARLPLVKEDEEIPGRTAVKTYLLEAHPPGKGKTPHLDLLTELARPMGFFVRQTQDDNLLLLEHPSEKSDFWCDTSLGRFWRLHTTAKVDVSNKFATQLTGI